MGSNGGRELSLFKVGSRSRGPADPAELDVRRRRSFLFDPFAELGFAFLVFDSRSMVRSSSANRYPALIDTVASMKFTCPWCKYDGPFEDGKVPFLVFGLLDVGRERRKAKRTYTCPECSTQIVLPKEAKQMRMRSD